MQAFRLTTEELAQQLRDEALSTYRTYRSLSHASGTNSYEAQRLREEARQRFRVARRVRDLAFLKLAQ